MKMHPKLVYLLLAAALLLTLVNCNKEEPVKQANLITLSVTNITTNTARGGGSITNDGGGDITSRGVVWSTSVNPTLDDNDGYTADGSGIGMFASLIVALTPNTTYYLRAYATNEAGMVYGNEQQFTTDGTAPEVSTSEISNITSNSFESGGIITNDGGAPVSSRGVVWSTYPNPTIENNEGFSNDGIGVGEFTSRITELTPGTTYYVKAYANNNFGTGYGEQLSFTSDVGGNGQPGEGVIDIDGNFYPSVIIGNQEWMAENLRVTRDASGIKIARYSYNNDPTNFDFYGGLYTWHTLMNGAAGNNSNPSNVQGICPTGWHVPSDAEWDELVNYVIVQGHLNEHNNPNGAGTALKSCRQVSSILGGDCAISEHPRWDSHSTHFGTDEYGFSGLPGGYRDDDGTYISLGSYGEWWSASELSPTNSWGRGLSFRYGNIYQISLSKSGGFSVRCLRD